MNTKFKLNLEMYANENGIDTTDYLARIVQKDYFLYTIATKTEIISNVKIAPQLIHDELYVGDFVAFNWKDQDCYIEQVFKRKNMVSKAFSHAAKSYHDSSYEQILATNVDQLFIVLAADQRFTLPKLERYLLTFQQQSLNLNILLSKADYVEETKGIIELIASYYPKINIMSVSIYQNESIRQLKDRLEQGKTAMFIGASGVGKSSLINKLLRKSSEKTNLVRTDGKGKHTTTVTKMLHVDETNSYLIDSPGFKAISTTKEMDGSVLFEDIQNLAIHCKFNNCTHQHEPSCAVLHAIELGELSAAQLERYAIYEKKLNGTSQYEKSKKLKKHKNAKPKKKR